MAREGGPRESDRDHNYGSPDVLDKEDLTVLGELETRKITPVIDRRYSLRELPDAIRDLETGHARGKMVVTL